MDTPIAAPGGNQLARRPLHLIWMLDSSGSMAADGKIQALNAALREVIPQLREIADDQADAELKIQALTFSDGARWLTPHPVPVSTFVWQDLEADGVTDMGKALRLVAEQLHVPPMPARAKTPIILLVSDGQPTDDFVAGLDALLNEPWGRKAVRLAIGIGRDVDHDVLKRFIGNAEIPPLAAHSPEQLIQYIKWTSTVVKEVSRPRVESATSTPALAGLSEPEAAVVGEDALTW